MNNTIPTMSELATASTAAYVTQLNAFGTPEPQVKVAAARHYNAALFAMHKKASIAFALLGRPSALFVQGE